MKKVKLGSIERPQSFVWNGLKIEEYEQCCEDNETCCTFGDDTFRLPNTTMVEIQESEDCFGKIPYGGFFLYNGVLYIKTRVEIDNSSPPGAAIRIKDADIFSWFNENQLVQYSDQEYEVDGIIYSVKDFIQ